MTQQQQHPTITVGGRLVGGDVVNGKTEDSEGRPLLIKNGPNAGQPRSEWYVGLAIPKTPNVDWKQEPWGQTLVQVAKAHYPSLFDTQGNLVNPQLRFAFKVTDGDSQIPNTKNVKPCDREGYPGHWVLHFANGFAPKLYQMLPGEASATPLQPGVEIKGGYYVEVFGSVKSNNAQGDQSGLFLNVSMVCLRGYGPEIVTGPSVEAAGFGASQIAGASATPVGGFGQPAQEQSAPVQQQTVTPATDLVEQPPVLPGSEQAPPPPPVEESYIYNGVTKTKSQWLQMPGWTEAHLANLQKV